MENSIKIVLDFLKENKLDSNLFYNIEIKEDRVRFYSLERKKLEKRFKFEKYFYSFQNKLQFYISKNYLNGKKIEIVTSD